MTTEQSSKPTGPWTTEAQTARADFKAQWAEVRGETITNPNSGPAYHNAAKALVRIARSVESDLLTRVRTEMRQRTQLEDLGGEDAVYTIVHPFEDAATKSFEKIRTQAQGRGFTAISLVLAPIDATKADLVAVFDRLRNAFVQELASARKRINDAAAEKAKAEAARELQMKAHGVQILFQRVSMANILVGLTGGIVGTVVGYVLGWYRTAAGFFDWIAKLFGASPPPAL